MVTRKHLLFVLPGLLISVVTFAVTLTYFLILYATGRNIGLQIAVQVIAMTSGTLFIRGFLLWFTYVVVVTPQSIIVQQGILIRVEERIDLNIATVRISQSIPGRLWNSGRLEIDAANNQRYSIGPLGSFQQVCRVLGMR